MLSRESEEVPMNTDIRAYCANLLLKFVKCETITYSVSTQYSSPNRHSTYRTNKNKNDSKLILETFLNLPKEEKYRRKGHCERLKITIWMFCFEVECTGEHHATHLVNTHTMMIPKFIFSFNFFKTCSRKFHNQCLSLR